MKNFKSQIISQNAIAEGYRELEFTWPSDCETPRPGQFLTIRIQDSAIPLLRRPFALSAFKEGSASIIYQIRGKGTQRLATLPEGSAIDVLSPLGNGFSMPDQEKNLLLVAGGIGLGPILYLARELDRSGYAPLLVFGCRNKSFIPELPSLKNGRIQFCTDDGSAGFKGTSVDYLKSLDNDRKTASRLYACGPLLMLKACHDFAVSMDMPCETAMEEMMACGVGACMGCAVELTDPVKKYARVCKDGPVFQSRDLKWT